MEPITFPPLYMPRIWGGRSLESTYSRTLPDDQPYGESWEMSDREHEQSIVHEGPYAGRSLHDLWSNHRDELFGAGLTGDRFPLLIKILDARDDLSIQVHPPPGGLGRAWRRAQDRNVVYRRLRCGGQTVCGI